MSYDTNFKKGDSIDEGVGSSAVIILMLTYFLQES